MTLDRSVLLIVVAISTTTYATDKVNSGDCRCRGTGEVVVALNEDSISVPLTLLASTHPGEFSWKPSAAERKWVYVVIHHSATGSGSVDSIHQNHRQRKDKQGQPWLGIGYHFVIGNGSGMGDGEVESTFRWKQQIHGAHSGSAVHNANGIGICLIGNFQENAPSEKQIAAVTRLIGTLAKRYEIPSRLVIGHNSVKPTACPGKLFPLQDVKRNSLLIEKTGNQSDRPLTNRVPNVSFK